MGLGRHRHLAIFFLDRLREGIHRGTFAPATGDWAVWVLGEPVGDVLRVTAVPTGLAPRKGRFEGSDLPAPLRGPLRAEHEPGVRAHREQTDCAPWQALAALRARLYLDAPLDRRLPLPRGDGAQVGGVDVWVVAAARPGCDGAVAHPGGEALHVATDAAAAVSARDENLLRRRVAQHAGHLDGAVELGSRRPHLPRVEQLLVRDEPLLRARGDAALRLGRPHSECRLEAAHDDPAHALNVARVIEVSLQKLYAVGAHPGKQKTPAKHKVTR